MAITTPRSASSSGQRRQAGRAYPTAVAPVQAIITSTRAPTANGWAYLSTSRTASTQTYAREANRNTARARQSGTSKPPGGRRHGGQDATAGPAAREPTECASRNPDVRWKSREILRDPPSGRAHDERRSSPTAYGCAHRTCPPDRRGLRPGPGDRDSTLGHLLRARLRPRRPAAGRLRARGQRADHQRGPARRRPGLAAALAGAGRAGLRGRRPRARHQPAAAGRPQPARPGDRRRLGPLAGPGAERRHGDRHQHRRHHRPDHAPTYHRPPTRPSR